MSVAGLSRVVDFHAHWLPPGVGEPPPAASVPGPLRHVWPLLGDLDAEREAAGRDGVDLRVLSTALELVAEPGERIDPGLVRRVNDALAAAVRDRGPGLTALATVDAFAGEAAAEEARRAIDDLGLPGLFVAAVSGELLLDAPEARPVLELAAERGVPVFAHPVNPPVLPSRFAGVVGAGHALGRATESAASTLALLRSGLLSALADLRVVITQLGEMALLLAHYVATPEPAPDGTTEGWRPLDDRSRLYVDTAGFEPIAIRAALEAVGPGHLLVGSDRPIAPALAPAGLTDVLRRGGVADADQDRVAAGNALDLLGLALAPATGAEAVAGHSL
jgi:predicted TIM-barrel fold metal-dependent hydrolase